MANNNNNNQSSYVKKFLPFFFYYYYCFCIFFKIGERSIELIDELMGFIDDTSEAPPQPQLPQSQQLLGGSNEPQPRPSTANPIRPSRPTPPRLSTSLNRGALTVVQAAPHYQQPNLLSENNNNNNDNDIIMNLNNNDNDIIINLNSNNNNENNNNDIEMKENNNQNQSSNRGSRSHSPRRHHRHRHHSRRHHRHRRHRSHQGNRNNVEITGMEFLSQQHRQRIQNILNRLNNETINYDELQICLGMLFEELNYEIQLNKQFKNNYISINGEPIKFTFMAVITLLYIDNTIESDFENGKFKNMNVIKKLRAKTERKYNIDNNNEIFSDLYKEAMRFKRNVC